MTISRGQQLLGELNPDPNKVKRIIECLRWESSYVQECINKGSRDLDSGQEVIKEISELIKNLEKKL
jgi:hypothetical protein